jgi:hypothetical protein
MRKRSTATEAPPAAEAPPHVIHPAAVYTVAQAQAALHLRQSTIRRELKEHRLRVAKRAGRYYLLGEWLLEWIREGEIGRRAKAGLNGTATNGHAPAAPPPTPTR